MENRSILPQWCKEAKKAMIDRDLTIADIATMTGKTKRWIGGIINGRIYSPNMVKEISDILGIADSWNFL